MDSHVILKPGMPASGWRTVNLLKFGVFTRIRRSIVLTAAFAAMLMIIAVSSYAVWRNARLAQARTADLHEAHMRAGGALAVIRANVYLTGILTRDYLLDADVSRSSEYHDQFRAIRQRTNEAFQILESIGQDGQKAALERLRNELTLYWDPTEIALDWTPEEKAARRVAFLRQRVGRRQEIFALASKVEDLISSNFSRERERITSADRDFRSSLGYITAFALLASICIIGLTLARMVQLERVSLEAESELRRLSGQLRTAQEQERKYLSRELHDQVGQMLTALRMELASMARTLADSTSDMAARITHAKGTVEQTLRVVRNVAMLLRPSMLDDLGLTPALAWHIKEFSRSSGMAMHSEVDPAADSLPDPYRTCLYRVIQEALTNCARHSGARNVHVTIRVERDAILASVSDDGRGFDPTSEKGPGLGLIGIEERVRELDGSVRVSSSPGNGVRLEIRLPHPGPMEESDDSHPARGRSRDRSDRVEASAGAHSGHSSSR
jgi:signal transduction histidine kinase